MMARNVLESITLLTNVSRLFADRCISGLVANTDRLRTLAESSPRLSRPSTARSATRLRPPSPSTH